jgi:hypothetical protein
MIKSRNSITRWPQKKKSEMLFTKRPWDDEDNAMASMFQMNAKRHATYSLVLLLDALGLLRDVKTHTEDSGGNTKTSLSAQGRCGGDGLVDVKKSGVDLGVARQGVGLEVAAANGGARFGDLLQVP